MNRRKISIAVVILVVIMSLVGAYYYATRDSSHPSSENQGSMQTLVYQGVELQVPANWKAAAKGDSACPLPATDLYHLVTLPERDPDSCTLVGHIFPENSLNLIARANWSSELNQSGKAIKAGQFNGVVVNEQGNSYVVVIKSENITFSFTGDNVELRNKILTTMKKK